MELWKGNSVGVSQIPDSHKDIVEKSQVAILGTNGPKGAPQLTATWFLFDGDTLRISLNNNRQKLKNLQKDPRASAFFIDPENPYRTLELRGSVEIEADPDYAFADNVGAKYGGANLREMDQPGETRSTVTFKVEKVLAFGE